MPKEEYEAAGKAVLEHHFDNHEFCGNWCRRKTETPEQQEAGKRYYRSKTTDSKLYEKLSEVISRFITLDRLKDVGHGMDTQVNESFNNTASWFAPKNKVFCGSRSLWNRLGLAVGINSIGYVAYFTRLFHMLGVEMDESTRYYLVTKDRTRTSRLLSLQTKAVKKRRTEKKYKQLKGDEMIARKNKAKRDGVYKRGMNMDTMEVEEDSNLPKAKKIRSTRAALLCPLCNKKGHTTAKARGCRANPVNPEHQQWLLEQLGDDSNAIDEPVGLDVEMIAAGDDMDNVDTLALDDDGDDDDIFFDAPTWSDGEYDSDDASRGMI